MFFGSELDRRVQLHQWSLALLTPEHIKEFKQCEISALGASALHIQSATIHNKFVGNTRSKSYLTSVVNLPIIIGASYLEAVSYNINLKRSNILKKHTQGYNETGFCAFISIMMWLRYYFKKSCSKMSFVVYSILCLIEKLTSGYPLCSFPFTIWAALPHFPLVYIKINIWDITEL